MTTARILRFPARRPRFVALREFRLDGRPGRVMAVLFHVPPDHGHHPPGDGDHEAGCDGTDDYIGEAG